MKQQFDIAIVGAGIVGCMLANLLAQRMPRISIALIDKKVPKPFDLQSDVGLRVYAVNHASQQLFEELGLWSSIQQQRVCAYEHMTVWQQPEHYLSFHADEIGQSDLGHIVEHDLLHTCLYQQVESHNAITLFTHTEIQDMQVGEDKARLRLTAGEVEARLVVAADGAESVIRQYANISVQTNPYLQAAIVAVVETEKPHQYTAWQRFLDTGPLAFLPLADGRSSIVWSLPQQQAETLLASSDAVFIQQLSEQSQSPLGQVKRVNTRAKFVLQQQQAESYASPRVALVGDAAHVVHPLAGQGLNLGLYDADLLSTILSAANARQTDLGQYMMLKRYARQSQLHNRIMAEAFGALNNVFISRHTLLQNARDNGLQIMQKSGLLKRFFIQQAIGKI